MTTKHHDGYALFDTATTGRDSVDLTPHRDLVGELFAAARQRDTLRAGAYYSIPEWFNPAPRPGYYVSLLQDLLSDTEQTITEELVDALLFGTGPLTGPRNAYTLLPTPYTGYQPVADYASGHIEPQLRELLTQYQPDLLWCDIGGPERYHQSNRVIADWYNQAAITNPDGVVVNARCGDANTHRDFETHEVTGSYGQVAPCGEFGEVARTLGRSWGYDTRDTDDVLLAPDELVDLLVNTAANNCTLTLNIGPRPDGTIPDSAAERLRAIGAWLDINGDAIYSTRPWTQAGVGDVRFTVGDDGTFYMTALNWPGRQLVVPADVPIPEGAAITLLGSDEHPLPYRDDNGSLVVDLPSSDPAQATSSNHAYVFRISPPATAAPAQTAVDGGGGAPSTATATAGVPAAPPVVATEPTAERGATTPAFEPAAARRSVEFGALLLLCALAASLVVRPVVRRSR